MNTAMVSVVCLAYNHEKYIRAALDSCLMQRMDFPLEIIVHDDASTDATADIIGAYAQRYPQVIKPVYQKENQYVHGWKFLLADVFPRCTGRYIAFCEGDDYWTDPEKLRKQVDFLEAQRDFVMSFTDCREVDAQGVVLKERCIAEHGDRTYTYDDMPVYAPTLTRVCRNVHFHDIPKSFAHAPGGDTYLAVWLSKFGKVRFQDFISADYRIIDQGVWSGKDSFRQSVHLFYTRYAILDIAEGKLEKKMRYAAAVFLGAMRTRARGAVELRACSDAYRTLRAYCRKKKNPRRSAGLDDAVFQVSVFFWYYLYFFIKRLKMRGGQLRLAAGRGVR
ncbi:MAG: glycosyltransferase [Candidatus Omnitrophica bacterium]|nr:glycosyltransferase [Candidatus Omnitrophota bacterium]